MVLMNICQVAKCWHLIFAIWHQYPLVVSKSWFVSFMVILTPWFHRSPLCKRHVSDAVLQQPVPQQHLPPIKLQLRCEAFCPVFISSARTTPRRSPTSIQCAFSGRRLHRRGKNNTALVIVKHHHGQFYIMSASWEWCFIARGWEERPSSHSLLSLSLWIFIYFSW